MGSTEGTGGDLQKQHSSWSLSWSLSDTAMAQLSCGRNRAEGGGGRVVGPDACHPGREPSSYTKSPLGWGNVPCLENSLAP